MGNQLCDDLGIKRKNPEIHAKAKRNKQQKSNLGHLELNKNEQENFKQLKRKRTLKHEKIENHTIKQFKREYVQLVNEENIVEFVIDEQSNFRKKINDKEIIQPSKDFKTLLDYDAIQTEFQILTNILDENSDSAAWIIKENLIKAFKLSCYGNQKITTEINLRTKNGESALSIAAKHGFSNIVKFLISKGAEKQYF